MMRRLAKLLIGPALFVAVVRTVAPGDAPARGWQAALIVATVVAVMVANLYIATKED